jgi:hypothetical protein
MFAMPLNRSITNLPFLFNSSHAMAMTQHNKFWTRPHDTPVFVLLR